jgi:hypothetical protein
MLTSQACIEDSGIDDARLPTGSRGFTFEPFVNLFEARLTSFPVFVAGIHHFHHGPRSRWAFSRCRHGRSVREGTDASIIAAASVKRYENSVKVDIDRLLTSRGNKSCEKNFPSLRSARSNILPYMMVD